MNSSTKISLYWLLIAFGLIIQASLELMKVVYFTVETHEASVDNIPTLVHTLLLITIIVPFIFSFLNTKISNKPFIWVSIIYAILLLVVNVYHFIGNGLSDLTNISKMVTLLFIPVINVFLIIELYNFKKTK